MGRPEHVFRWHGLAIVISSTSHATFCGSDFFPLPPTERAHPEFRVPGPLAPSGNRSLLVIMYSSPFKPMVIVRNSASLYFYGDRHE